MFADDQHTASGPFEGPEKLLEIWFASSPADIPDAHSSTDGKYGLRKVPRAVWEEMLDIVKCKILSVVEGMEMDAYLLSESSFFVSPHRLILKTCGTTLNLLGVPRILEIARDVGFPTVHRLFYSRKAFMFPERQQGPHREWKAEIEFLDNLFPNGSAYTVGKVNGDHWLLYLTAPGELSSGSGDTAPSSPQSVLHNVDGVDPEASDVPPPDTPAEEREDETDDAIASDYTIEILMTHLSPEGRAPFFSNSSPEDGDATAGADALALSSDIGITNIFPSNITTLDAYSFTPCGYSCNALLKWRPDAGQDPARSGEGYYTIHVTPEEGWSYASFECNVPLATKPTNKPTSVPDLKTLIRRVVNIFHPGKLTLTLFISSKDNDAAEEEEGETTVEAAQRAFKAALTLPAHARRKSEGELQCNGTEAGAAGLYKRTDKINYEFGGYDLAFASFELRT
ncbi:S-adenosylmethionine decarboxylase [Dichomitus squalens LYAD-421 SS1]|uniref:S-adenosylmethionine decarboxylase n=1 Tax=Dichomitus squalens (strain LYAD-421) TaxID=732165 RepID=UPI00044107D0|nr:S-adenosylmethionine decarboxylase [Dichomitus squalens LYAD-421 SS1]EJF65125.1 S-adenosylmethionine decarboxylase [Dichomitus squalens LYAD-421 SS1]